MGRATWYAPRFMLCDGGRYFNVAPNGCTRWLRRKTFSSKVITSSVLTTWASFASLGSCPCVMKNCMEYILHGTHKGALVSNDTFLWKGFCVRIVFLPSRVMCFNTCVWSQFTGIVAFAIAWTFLSLLVNLAQVLVLVAVYLVGEFFFLGNESREPLAGRNIFQVSSLVRTTSLPRWLYSEKPCIRAMCFFFTCTKSTLSNRQQCINSFANACTSTIYILQRVIKNEKGSEWNSRRWKMFKLLELLI